MARKRAGPGGGWEYHVSVLPEAAQADWQRRRERALAPAAPPAPAPARPVQDVTQLDARRRRVMEARAEVFAEVRRRVIVDEVSQRQAILSLVADHKADRQLPEGQRVLPAPVFDACGAANDRGDALSARSVFRWSSAAADGTAALAPQPSRPKSADGAWPWLPDLLRFYCRPTKPDLTVARAKLIELVGEDAAPSYGQCKRAIGSLAGTTRYLDAHRGREGRLALKARMAFKRRTVEGLEPTDVYTADGKTFDAEVAHPFHGRPFRPEITSILDVATRRCVGWSVALAETSDAVADALRMASTRHGICATFYTDRGPGYRNDRMDGAATGLCARLGTTPAHSLPYNSQARGVIERFNATVWNAHAATYETFVGAKMDREAKQAAFKQTRAEIKTFGASPILVGWAEFMRRAGAAVEAYNAAPHSALRRRDAVTGRWIERSPNDAWGEFEAGGFEAFRLEADDAADLFRPYELRMARRGEVQLLTNRYFHAELQPYDGLRVFVGYDIHDASQAWVRAASDTEDGLAPGALICVADWAGNATHYFPRSANEAARDRREAGRQRRIDAKSEEIAQERRAPEVIEHRPMMPLDPLPMTPEAVPVAAAPAPDTPPNPAAEPAPEEEDRVVPLRPAAPRYTDDFVLARDIIAGEAELTAGRYQLMANLVRNPAGRELLDYHGIEEASLRNLLRASPHHPDRQSIHHS